MRALALLSIVVTLTGCASAGAAWISASQFDRTAYAYKRVAVMPVVLDRSIEGHAFPASALQDALVEQLDLIDIHQPLKVTAAEAAGVPFPYTPERLAEFGKAQHYDAVVGATAVRLDERRRDWAFTGTITFVDSGNVQRTWTLARSWSMFGKPGDDADVRQALVGLLRNDFLDVREALRRGRTSVLLRRNTVVVDAGPALGIDAGDVPRRDPTFLQRVLDVVLNRPKRPALKTSAEQLSVDAFAIDDKGITRLWLENGNLKRPILGDPEVPLPTTQTAAQIQETKQYAPIFIAQRVGMPLTVGTNDIRVVSTNTEGQTVVRSLTVYNEKSAEIAAGGVSAAVIVATSFASLPGPAPTLLPEAGERIQEIESYDGATMDNGSRAAIFFGNEATRDNILRAITVEWSRPALGTRRVLMFVGRAELAVGLPYLMMHDARTRHPENDSISFDEFASLLKYEVARAIVDVCTNDTPPDALREALTRIASERLEVSVSGNCSQPIGGLFLSADYKELRKQSKRRSLYC